MPSRVEKMLAVADVTPPFDIMRAAYAELTVADLAASEHFYVDMLGLVVSHRTDDALYLRGWEERLHHSLVLRQAPQPACARLSFRVRANSDLEALAAEFERRECVVRFVEGELAGMGRALRVWDPFGFPLEFFHDMTRFETSLQRFDIQRGAPIMRLDHFNIHAPQCEETVTFWRELGFRFTEYIATDGEDERITGAWLARKPTVHDVALTAGRGPRLHHIGLYVAEPAGVLRACDQLAAAYHSDMIERGPGRHGVSNAFFVYLRDPDGHRIELYACDYYTGDPDHEPLRWSVNDPRCRSFWGTRAPDSWYEESSLVLGPDGGLVDTVDASIDEREAWTEVMS
ncbi:MAG TPA: 3,4-dihydroxyphenylacetate 2,3-dioxygenase [Solirubrobacteraceae bacterium]|nr:3,4-dihydroxyphenylacetate 2,3-dioxygenase [Solirubrobacteraceae bacterium]